MLEVSWTDWCGSGVEQVHRAPPVGTQRRRTERNEAGLACASGT